MQKQTAWCRLQGTPAEIREGFAVLKESRGILSLIMLMAFVCFFVGFLQTLVSPMVLAVSDAKTVGIRESVCAVGMLVGSVIIGVLGIRGSYVRTLSFAGMAASIFIALSGVSVNLSVTGAGIFLFFLLPPGKYCKNLLYCQPDVFMLLFSQ